MKTTNFLATLLLATLFLASCSNDDDGTPVAVIEEEVITTMTVTLTPVGGGTAVILQTRDLDGDGSDAPVVTVSGDLTAETTYTGGIVLLNETEDPAENITEEVEELDDEHQFFYTVSSGLGITAAATNFDGSDNPLGTQFSLTTTQAGSGTVTFTLRHEPKKPNTGLSDAGGETDIETTFSVVVE